MLHALCDDGVVILQKSLIIIVQAAEGSIQNVDDIASLGIQGTPIGSSNGADTAAALVGVAGKLVLDRTSDQTHVAAIVVVIVTGSGTSKVCWKRLDGTSGGIRGRNRRRTRGLFIVEKLAHGHRRSSFVATVLFGSRQRLQLFFGIIGESASDRGFVQSLLVRGWRGDAGPS